MKNKYNLKEQNIQLAHHNITICTQHTYIHTLNYCIIQPYDLYLFP